LREKPIRERASERRNEMRRSCEERRGWCFLFGGGDGGEQPEYRVFEDRWRAAPEYRHLGVLNERVRMVRALFPVANR
jgi:hypothetical protein